MEAIATGASASVASANEKVKKKKKVVEEDEHDGHDKDDGHQVDVPRTKHKKNGMHVYNEKPFPQLKTPISPLSTRVSSTFGRQVSLNL